MRLPVRALCLLLEIFIIFGIPFRSGQKSGRILRNASLGIAPHVNRDARWIRDLKLIPVRMERKPMPDSISVVIQAPTIGRIHIGPKMSERNSRNTRLACPISKRVAGTSKSAHVPDHSKRQMQSHRRSGALAFPSSLHAVHCAAFVITCKKFTDGHRSPPMSDFIISNASFEFSFARRPLCVTCFLKIARWYRAPE
jgi:hypothetical protein